MISKPPTVVLVVEDQDLVRLLAADALGELGYDVLEAYDSAEALRIATDTMIDVLFTDIGLPGGPDGIQLANRVRSTTPDVGIVLTSGGRVDRPTGIPSDWVWLAKPYGPAQLAASIAVVSEKLALE